MKSLLPVLAALLLPSLPLGAQITADLAISEGGSPLGTMTLKLDHVKAPVATANFIGLATGKFPWIDSTTGVVQYNKPYYDGIIFHRVIAGFMNQTGSQKGDGSDGPGYSFPDAPETTNGLTHASGHVISMANSGPNSNGSQIFITVGPANHLNGKHIVFGSVAEGSSQTLANTINGRPVIDADGPDDDPNTPEDNNNRPVTDITIDSITVHYNGVSFDPSAQGLPAVSSPKLSSLPDPSSTALDFTQPARSLAQVAYTTNLSSWSVSDDRYLDENDSALSSFDHPAAATGNPSQLFAPALITYGPTAIFPSSLANRTFSAFINGNAIPFICTFDASGVTGTWSYPNPTNPIGGPIPDSLFLPDGYGGRLILIAQGLIYDYRDFKRIGFDTSSATQLSGRHSGTIFADKNTPFEASLSISGTNTLSR